MTKQASSLKSTILKSGSPEIIDCSMTMTVANQLLRSIYENQPRKNFFEEVQEQCACSIFKYGVTVVAGTFDHLHSGHRLLLTQTALLTKNEIRLGVTTDGLLQKKENFDLIEDYNKRSSEAIKFLQQLNPSVKITCFELSDPIGICGTATDVDACILTRETEKGGIMINNKRAENKLPPMNMVFVDMVLANVNEKGEGQYSNKVSSTNIRKFIAENK